MKNLLMALVVFLFADAVQANDKQSFEDGEAALLKIFAPPIKLGCMLRSYKFTEEPDLDFYKEQGINTVPFSPFAGEGREISREENPGRTSHYFEITLSDSAQSFELFFNTIEGTGLALKGERGNLDHLRRPISRIHYFDVNELIAEELPDGQTLSKGHDPSFLTMFLESIMAGTITVYKTGEKSFYVTHSASDFPSMNYRCKDIAKREND